jgi:hypothetical protein
MQHDLKSQGGYAFPQTETKCGNSFGAEYGDGGMTLRDYFAAQALAGMCANTELEENSTYSDMASNAYGYADAMLKERAK